MLLLATKEKPLWLSPIILFLFALFSVLGTDQVAQLTLESTVTRWVLPLQSLEQWSSSARASQAAGKVSSTFLKVLAITSLHFSVFWALFLSVYFWGGVCGCRSDADCAWTHITHSQVPWCANFSLPIDAQLPAAGDYCLGTLLASRSAPCAYNRSSSCFLYFPFSHCVWVEALKQCCCRWYRHSSFNCSLYDCIPFCLQNREGLPLLVHMVSALLDIASLFVLG